MMKKILKAVGLPKLKNKLWQMQLRGRSHEQVFTDIYQKNKWGDAESISGPGSTLDETEFLRGALDKLFADYKIKTIIDLPCGDYNWFKELNHPFEQYTGCDIVEDLIVNNNKQYGDDTHVFKKVDCLSERIDDADMIIARDLLIHFSCQDILKFFENLRRSNITYILTSHFIKVDNNNDIVTGQGRIVNLTKPPFNLPQPEHWFLERSKVYDGLWHDNKGLALWKLEDVYQALDAQKVGAEAA